MRSTFRALAVGCIACAALIAAGCNKETEKTPSTGSAIPVLDQFTGTLQPSGDAFYSFAMAQPGTVSLTLISVTGPSVPEDATFLLGLGIPAGTGCTASVDAAAKPGASPQYTTTRSTGVFCVRISDNARLGAAATFVLNITHPR